MNTRRAFFGALSGLATSAATAEAQLRTPTLSRPTFLPDAELKLLRRITNGPIQEDVATIAGAGYQGYLEWQLNPESINDVDVANSPEPDRAAVLEATLAGAGLSVGRIGHTESGSGVVLR